VKSLPLIDITIDRRDWRKMFYYNDGENEIGPFSQEKILKLKEGALIGDRTLIRRADNRFWLPLNEIPELGSVPHQRGWTRKTKSEDRRNLDAPETIEDSSASYKPQKFQSSERIEGEPVGFGGVEKANDDSGWMVGPPSPWRRFGARSLDIGINGAFGFFLFGIALYAVAPATAESFFLVFQTQGGRVLDTLATGLMASLVGGALIGSTGSTVGKLIFGIRVTSLDGTKLGLLRGVQRDLNVLLKGLGLGIPIISLITLWISYKNLVNQGLAVWDKDKYVVFYRPRGLMQTVLNLIGVFVIVIMLMMFSLADQL
jgi:uncharacterized RDD family membrane protein YckC